MDENLCCLKNKEKKIMQTITAQAAVTQALKPVSNPPGNDLLLR